MIKILSTGEKATNSPFEDIAKYSLYFLKIRPELKVEK
jgi:hypothetical protein